MTTLRESLEKFNKLSEELKKQQEAPKRSFRDKLTGKKSIEKEYKLPSKVTSGVKRKLKKNYAIVIYIRNNGFVHFNYAPIEDDLIYIKESQLYHAATADYILKTTHKGKIFPLLIQPEWALTPITQGETVNKQQVPFSPKDHADITKKAGDIASKQKILIDIVKQSQIQTKKNPLAGKSWLWIIVGAVVILYLLNTLLTGGKLG